MIVLDTSAVIAILTSESGRPQLVKRLSDEEDRRLSAPQFVECAQVASRHGDAVARERLQEFIDELAVRLEPFTQTHAHIARDAFLKFGKGRGHPAQLNQMDCIAYALAKCFDAPLLFIGKDFSHTDIRPALTPGAA